MKKITKCVDAETLVPRLVETDLCSNTIKVIETTSDEGQNLLRRMTGRCIMYTASDDKRA